MLSWWNTCLGKIREIFGNLCGEGNRGGGLKIGLLRPHVMKRRRIRTFLLVFSFFFTCYMGFTIEELYSDNSSTRRKTILPPPFHPKPQWTNRTIILCHFVFIFVTSLLFCSMDGPPVTGLASYKDTSTVSTYTSYSTNLKHAHHTKKLYLWLQGIITCHVHVCFVLYKVYQLTKSSSSNNMLLNHSDASLWSQFILIISNQQSTVGD